MKGRYLVLASGLLLLAPRVGVAQDMDQDFGGSRYGGAPETETGEPAPGVESPERHEMHPPRTTTTEPAVTPTPMEPRERQEEGEDRGLMSRFGIGLSVGGGVSDFVDDDTEGLTDVGGTWDARLILGTRSMVALEAAYIGSASNIEALGLDNDALLMSNGVEGLVRVNVGTFAVQPFVFGGAAWQRYSLVNEDFNTSSIENEDNVLAVPVGGGVSAYIPGTRILVDGRFTYRAIFDENMFDLVRASANGGDLDNWNVSARVGFEF